MIVVFEGLPGSGKSTALRAMSSLVDVTLIDEILDTEPKNADEDFFIANDIAKYQAIEQQRTCVIDRNFVSTLCFNHCFDEQFGTNNFDRVAQKIHDAKNQGLLFEPDLYVYFQCTPQTSRRRQNASNASIWQDTAFLCRAEAFYKNHFANIDCPVKNINTETMSAEEVHETIIQTITQCNHTGGNTHA